MRVLVSHETIYRYTPPAAGVIQLLRFTPRNHSGQYIVDWRIDVSENCQIQQQEDAFGNTTHVLTGDGELEELHIRVDGEVETYDTHGVVSGSVERFPPGLYLRETSLTQADAGIVEFAKLAAGGSDPLDSLHRLMEHLNKHLVFDASAAGAPRPAAEAFAAKRGVCRDFAHVFIAAARHLGIPARYIGGHFLLAEDEAEKRAGHAWAEAFVPDLGWVAFDAAHCICTTDAHVRVAMGLDYLGAAPARGSHKGGGEEVMEFSIRVSADRNQTQSQS